METLLLTDEIVQKCIDGICRDVRALKPSIANSDYVFAAERVRLAMSEHQFVIVKPYASQNMHSGFTFMSTVELLAETLEAKAVDPKRVAFFYDAVASSAAQTHLPDEHGYRGKQ